MREKIALLHKIASTSEGIAIGDAALCGRVKQMCSGSILYRQIRSPVPLKA
jgi:hypothetical protein